MLVSVAIGEIRRGLSYPHEAELPDTSILMELWQVITYSRSLLNLTHEPWEIKRWPFYADAGTITEKNLSVGDFGEAIFIQSKDDSNPYFIPRTISVVGPEEMSMYYSGPTTTLVGGMYTPHVAQVFSIFRENNQWKIKWLPAHQNSAQYELWYTPGAPIVPPIYTDTTKFPIESQNWFIINNCIVNLMPHLADEEMGLNPKQQILFQSAQSKIAQWSPILEANRWDGPHREPIQHRKIFGRRRSGNNFF